MEKKKAYELLGIDENASIADVQTAYMKKRAENNEARFSGKSTNEDVVKKIEEIDEAYRYVLDHMNTARYAKNEPGETKASEEPIVGEIVGVDENFSDEGNKRFSDQGSGGNKNFSGNDEDNEAKFKSVEELLRKNTPQDIEKAQRILDEMSQRPAEWPYWQSIIYYKKYWYLESKKQLELAMDMDPGNSKYKKAHDKLEKIMASKNTDPSQMYSDNNGTHAAYNDAPMNNGTCTGSCCGDVCLANLCCNCSEACCCR